MLSSEHRRLRRYLLTRGVPCDDPSVSSPGCGGPLPADVSLSAPVDGAGPDPRADLTGRSMGEFRLVREIGRGGMGTVYEAEQESLGRRVAIKVLSVGTAADESRVRRFSSEARAVARLSHPSIVPVYTSGRGGDRLFFAMELVRGDNLDRLRRRAALLPERVARIGIDVARGLAYAHAHGVIHRDVKPANILLDAEGRARIADFGLAVETGGDPGAGRIAGTPAYMAPEQVRGETPTPATDVYGLGASLYTALVGHPPFPGDDPAAVLTRVLQGRPAEAPAPTPRHEALLRICRRAMAFSPGERYATPERLAVELERLLSSWTEPTRRGVDRRRVATAGAVLAAALIAVTFAVRATGRGTTDPAPPVSRDAAVLPPPSPFRALGLPPQRYVEPALSSDGRTLAATVVTDRDRRLVRIDVATATVTELDSSQGHIQGVFAPDDRAIFYNGGHGFARVDRGGRRTRLLERSFAQPALSPDGTRVAFVNEPPRILQDTWRGASLSVADIHGRGARLLTSMPVVMPAWSPTGRHIAFASGSSDRGDLWLAAAADGSLHKLTDEPTREWGPQWPAAGRFLYYAAEHEGRFGIRRLEVDPATGRAVGPPQPVHAGFLSSEFNLALSRDGRRVAINGWGDPGQLVRLRLDASRSVVRDARRIRRIVRGVSRPAISPDGERVVYATRDGGNLFVVDRDGNGPRALLEPGPRYGSPRWSPDGSRIAFRSDRSGSPEIWVLGLDRPILERVTDTPGEVADDPVWSPDGTSLAFRVEGGGAFIVPVDGDGSSEPLPPPPAPLGDLPFVPTAWSPDGRRLAGNAAGVVVYSLDDGRYTRLTGSGSSPVWVGDADRLLYVDGSEVLTVDAGGGTPRLAFSAAPSELDPHLSVDAAGSEVFVSAMLSDRDVFVMDLPPLR